MQPREINGRPEWTYFLPDKIAEWDAPSHWERERLASMQAVLKPGWVLYDIGTEHGWLTAVYGSFTGHGNLVLVEPGSEMWVNIAKTWIANGFDAPIAAIPFFAGAEDCKKFTAAAGAAWKQWPTWVDLDGPEEGAMAYRYLDNPGDIGVITIDSIRRITKRKPDAITIDVEGYEMEVIKGAAKTLTEDRPHLWVSVHPDLMEKHCGIERVEELFELIQSYGYGREYLGTDHEQHHWFAPHEWEPETEEDAVRLAEWLETR